MTNTTIGIYWFDVFNNPHRAVRTVEIQAIAMDTAKQQAEQKAVDLKLLPNGEWEDVTLNYATRKYKTEGGSSRLIIIER